MATQPYLSTSDLLQLFGEEEVFAAFAVDLDASAVLSLIANASALIDAHIATRYSVPLPLPAPALVQRIAAAVVRYDYHAADTRERVEGGYREALRFLRDLRDGKIVLQAERAVFLYRAQNRRDQQRPTDPRQQYQHSFVVSKGPRPSNAYRNHQQPEKQHPKKRCKDGRRPHKNTHFFPCTLFRSTPHLRPCRARRKKALAGEDLLVAVEKSRRFCALGGVEEEDAVVAQGCGQVSDAVDPARFFVERGQRAGDSVGEGLMKGGGLRHGSGEARRIG